MTPGLPAGLRPSPAQAAILGLVVAPTERVEERWLALQPLDLDRLEQGSLALLPLAYERLVSAGLDDPRLPRLKGALHNVWYRNRLQLGRLPDLLRTAGAGAIVVGDVSAAGYYPGLGLRLIRRIDVMSARAEVVFGPGSVLHAGAPSQLAVRSRRRTLFEELAARRGTRTITIGDVRVPVVSAEDELVLACAAGALPEPGRTPQWLLDVWHVLRASPDLEAGRVAALAEELGLVLQVRDGIAYLRSIDDTLAVDGLATALAAVAPSRRDRLAFRLSGARVGRIGFLPRTLAVHLRATRRSGPARALLGLPAFLGEQWGVETRRVPLTAARKAFTRKQAAGRAP